MSPGGRKHPVEARLAGVIRSWYNNGRDIEVEALSDGAGHGEAFREIVAFMHKVDECRECRELIAIIVGVWFVKDGVEMP